MFLNGWLQGNQLSLLLLFVPHIQLSSWLDFLYFLSGLILLLYPSEMEVCVEEELPLAVLSICRGFHEL